MPATACFTGHRQINGHYYNRHTPSPEWHTLKEFMTSIVGSMMDAPYNVDHFISGLAIGVDMLGAEAVALARCFGKGDIKLTGAMPFPSQPNKWPEPTRQHWTDICAICNNVVAVSPDPYSPQKMQIRNKWMVAQSDYVIAVWNGMEKGGTWNCMQYALSQGKPILMMQLNGLMWDVSWRLPEGS